MGLSSRSSVLVWGSTDTVSDPFNAHSKAKFGDEDEQTDRVRDNSLASTPA